MGVGAAPVTRRPETPLTLALVTAERWAAHVAGDEAPDGPQGSSSRPVALEAVAELGVEWRDPLPAVPVTVTAKSSGSDSRTWRRRVSITLHKPQRLS